MTSVAEGPPLDDGSLDDREFRDLVDRYARPVRRKLCQLGVPRMDCQDTVQEVFLVIHRKVRRSHDRALLASLVNIVCVRVASTYRRNAYNRHRAKIDGEALEEHLCVEPDQEIEMDRLG